MGIDGTSVMRVVKMQAPRLHYVHPYCFEAGKPMEFVACGSNLLRPKFRCVNLSVSSLFYRPLDAKANTLSKEQSHSCKDLVLV